MIEIELDGFIFECDGNYYDGTKMSYSLVDDQFMPGDPPDVSHFKVFMPGPKRLEVTDNIPENKLEELRKIYLEEMYEERRA